MLFLLAFRWCPEFATQRSAPCYTQALAKWRRCAAPDRELAQRWARHPGAWQEAAVPRVARQVSSLRASALAPPTADARETPAPCASAHRQSALFPGAQ